MKKEKKVEPTSASPAFAKQVLAAVPAQISTKAENKPCSKSCGPGDWYKGGKCDKNGCYYE